LEIGCGYGRVTPLLKIFSENVTGLDPNKEVLQDLENHFPGIEAVKGFAEDLPFEDNSFDLIYTRGVLQHIPESSLENVVSEIERVLQPNGVLFIQELTWDKPRFYKQHLHPRTEETYQELFSGLDLEDRGFARKMMSFDFPDDPHKVNRIAKSSMKFRDNSDR